MNYYGSKWNAAEWVLSHFPEHEVYAEAFGGSAAILLKKPRSGREIINDLDSEIFNLYKVIRDSGNDLKELLKKTPFGREEFELSFQPSNEDIERARRLCVRAYFGIGNSAHHKTGMRIGTASHNCTAKSWVNYADSLDEIIERFRGVFIENGDYRELLRRYDTPETLFYLDPPYMPSTRTFPTNYKHDWKEEDHVEFLLNVSNLKGMAILSGYDHPSYDALGWKKVSKEMKSQKDAKKLEVLWISPNAQKRTAQNRK